VIDVLQQGQLVKLKKTTREGNELWAYRYRGGGRGAKRIQRGGFASERDAREALARALEKLRRRNGIASTLTLAELVEQYLAQHEAPVTLEKLRWLLTRAVAVFGHHRLDELRSPEIAAWRMTIPPGYRFEATQALRRCSPAPSLGACSTSIPPSRALRTRSGAALRSARSNPGTNLTRSPNDSAPASVRW
jgi:hypothetical protein